MKHDYWPRQLAVTAIAAMFAVPLAQAQQTTETPPISLPLGVTIPGLSNTIDMMKGNDARDTRDSTVLRNDVPFNEPAGGSNTVDTVQGNDARDARDSTVLRNDVNVERPIASRAEGDSTTHGAMSSEADRFPSAASTRGAGGNASAPGTGGGAGGGNGG